MSTSHDAEPHVQAEIDPVDIDRLRVAAHQVLRWTEEGARTTRTSRVWT